MMPSHIRFAIVPLLAIAPICLAGSAQARYSALNRSEYQALRYLAYPQSEKAMLSRFGRPIWRSGDYDYYPVGDNAMARVAYVGRRAQSVDFIVEGQK